MAVPAVGAWLRLPAGRAAAAPLDLSSDSEELSRPGEPGQTLAATQRRGSAPAPAGAALEGGALQAAAQRAPVVKRRRVVVDSDSDYELPPAQVLRTGTSSSSSARGPGPAAASASAADVSQASVATLVAMGFAAPAVAAALASCGGDVAAAAEALAETAGFNEVPNGRSGSAAASSSHAPSGSVPGSAAGSDDGADANYEPGDSAAEEDAFQDDASIQEEDSSVAALNRLTSMGFDRRAAQRALVQVGGSIEEAANVLAAGAAKLERAPAAAHGVSTRAGRAEVRAESRQPVRRGEYLAAISGSAKRALVEALVGPESHRTGRVESTVRRGRVALRKNFWEKHDSDMKLAGVSPCYEKLKGYQRVAVRWLLALAGNGVGGILADEMGLGKTAETLAFLDVLEATRKQQHGTIKDGQSPLSLVVVPASLMGNWLAEVKAWCPHFNVFQYYAQSQDDRGNLAKEYIAEYIRKPTRCHIILTTPGVLRNKLDRNAFFRRLNIEYLIYDEAHGVKNADAQKFRDIYRGLQVERRILLTGTPVQNSLRELGNLLTLLLAQNKPPEGARKPPGYRESVGAVEDLNDLVERGLLHTLQVRAAPFLLRRLKKDVMKDLPPKTGQTVQCELAPSQQEHYNVELAKARAEYTAGKPRRDFVKNLFFRLRRICNHPLLGQFKFSDADYAALVAAMKNVRPDFARATDAKALAEVKSWSDYEVIAAVRQQGLQHVLGQRFDLSRSELIEGSVKCSQMLQLLESQRKGGQKTLVFSQFTQYLDLIAEVLRSAGMPFARLDGSTSVGERPDIVRQFQDPSSGTDVFLLSTKAGGVGLNLTAADTVILMDLSFNPHDNRQAEDRVHRLGQTRPVKVHYFVCKGTIEDQILKINLDKMALDYKFGGQRMLLQDQPKPGTDNAQDDDEEEEDGEEDIDLAAVQKQAKKAELDALAALERAMR